MYLEIELLTNGPPESVHYLIDAPGTKLAHLTKLNPLLLKQMIHFLQHCYPVRVGGIHVLKNFPFLDKFVAIIQPFLEVELHIHDSIESVYNFLPAEVIPSDFQGGGGAKDLKTLNSEWSEYN